MRPHRLDASTADRLLSGAVSPDDAPPGYVGVAHLLGAAGTGLGAGELAREVATVAAMQAAVLGHLTPTTINRGKKMISKILTVKAAAASVAVLMGAGSAAAATGSLPSGVQNAAATVLAQVGITVPNGHHSSHANADNGQSTGPNANAAFGQCTAATAQAAAGHQPNSHAPASPSNCPVPHPGNTKGTGNATNAGSQGGPPASTRGSSQPTVTTPNLGTAGSTPSGAGASASGTSTAGTNDGGASSTGAGAAQAGSGNATARP
ncbi:MAG: hypothetical protein ACYDD4_04570 [Acidimicrobiales bacterium]